MSRRYTIAGISGSGKTTTGRLLADRLGLPYVELDSLNHGPNWTEATPDELRARVERAIAAAPNGWVLDGNYRSKIGDLVLRNADTLIWLDLPLRTCLRRLWRRTWRRILHREVLWNGNRENLRGAFVARDSLFAWTIRSYFRHRRELPQLVARLPHLRLVRLRSEHDVRRWLETV